MALRDPRHLLQADFAAAAQVLMRAFAGDPVVRWVIGADDQHYPVAGERFFSTLIPRSHRRGHAYLLATGTTVEGVALWSPPEVPMFGQDDGGALRDTLIEIAGEAALVRMGALGEAMGSHHPHEPHFYLGTVGVDPDLRGRGVGVELLAPLLARCDAEGLGSYLESSNPRNISFYERLGYEVTSYEEVDAGVVLQGMWRQPRPS